VLFDAPPTVGHNLQRAVDEIAAANGVSNKQCRHSSLSLTRHLVSGHRLVQAIAVPPGFVASSIPGRLPGCAVARRADADDLASGWHDAMRGSFRIARAIAMRCFSPPGSR
jgi:hypothetical protein